MHREGLWNGWFDQTSTGGYSKLFRELTTYVRLVTEVRLVPYQDNKPQCFPKPNRAVLNLVKLLRMPRMLLTHMLQWSYSFSEHMTSWESLAIIKV